MPGVKEEPQAPIRAGFPEEVPPAQGGSPGSERACSQLFLHPVFLGRQPSTVDTTVGEYTAFRWRGDGTRGGGEGKQGKKKKPKTDCVHQVRKCPVENKTAHVREAGWWAALGWVPGAAPEKLECPDVPDEKEAAG